MLLYLADENIPLKSFDFLKNKGYNIKHVGIENSSIKDYEVINLAINEGRIIITFDSDFGELVFRQGYQPIGIIYFRWKEFKPAEPGSYLHQLIEENKIQIPGYFTVIDHNQIRQRKI